MLEQIINYGTALAFLAVGLDVVMQIARVYRRKSSMDISLAGTLVRFVAVSFFVAKFVMEGDSLLIVGQIIFSVLMLAYVWVIIRYRKKS